MQEPTSHHHGVNAGGSEASSSLSSSSTSDIPLLKRPKLEKKLSINDNYDNSATTASSTPSSSSIVKLSPRKREKRINTQLAAVDRAFDRMEDKEFGCKVAAFLRDCVSQEIWSSHIHTFPPSPVQWRPFPEDLHPSLQQVL